MQHPVLLDGHTLTLDALARLANAPQGGAPRAAIPAEAHSRLRASRQALESLDLGATAYYGINTGFGKLCDVRIAEDAVECLQGNLVRSHAVGVGAPVPDEIVRLMLALKIQSLVRGHSAVQPIVVERLLDFLNHDILPVVPSQGSVGASGDLAPLAHLALPLLGEGLVRVGGVTMAAADALAKFGLSPVQLAAKDGLALINGTQFMGAYGAWIMHRAWLLAYVADAAVSMSLEGMCGLIAPFDPRIHAVRPHPGAALVARRVRAMTAESELIAGASAPGRVQDPYSLRCSPQVHGASRDALGHITRTLEIEFNSTTDNPLVFDDGSVLSGGNFHGQPLALSLDFAAIAIAELASISERRTYLLLEGRAELPRMLTRDSGLNSGLMIAQYTSAALVSENKVLAHPASVDTIPTCLGQEDHVSMGSIAGVKGLRVLENAEMVLAIELLCAAQAVDLQDRSPGVGVKIAHALIRACVPPLHDDRSVANDITRVAELIRTGSFLSALKEFEDGSE